MAALVQAIGERKLVSRYFWITNDFTKSVVPNQTVKEVTRTVIDYETEKVTDYEYYWIPGHVDVMDWTPCKASMFCPDGIHHKFFDGVMHKDGLMEELRKAGLDLRCGDFEAAGILDSRRETVLKETLYFEVLLKRPFIEKLIKCKLYSLAGHYYNGEYDSKGALLNTEATSLTGLLKISKNRLRQMVEANCDYKGLYYAQEAGKNPLYQSLSLEEICEYGKTFDFRLKNAFKLTVSQLRKTYKFVKDNQINPCDYFDYLDNAEFLHYNLSADSVRYPKAFVAEHDFAADEVKAKTDEKTYFKIQMLLPHMHERYDFEDENFLITAPANGKAIKDEGTALHHCVGTYVQRVATGETVILFIRKKTNPNKPFVTVEVKNDTVIQVRALRNGTPEPAVWDFVKKFKKEKQVA